MGKGQRAGNTACQLPKSCKGGTELKTTWQANERGGKDTGEGRAAGAWQGMGVGVAGREKEQAQ